MSADVADASSRLEAYKRAAASRPARGAVYSGNGFHDVSTDALRVPAGHARRDDVLGYTWLCC